MTSRTPFGRRRRPLKDESGAAAVEFGLWLAVLAYPLVNVFDVSMYSYQRLQVENAAQMAVQGAFNACQGFGPPVFTNCNTSGSAGTNAVNAGAGSTSLGTLSTTMSEYVNGTRQTGGTLTSTPPSNSGDYLGVRVTYTYRPLFRAVSITNLLGSTITKTYWMRLS